MKSNCAKNRIYYALLLLAPLAFVESASACSDTSGDGCPTVVEIDDNAATLTGPWSSSSAILLWYGDDYEVALGSGGAPTATATFRSPHDVEVDGDYTIYARWSAHPNRCTSARYRIYDGTVSAANLVATVTKNQTNSGGSWQRLGTYDQFTKNRNPRVVVDNQGCAGKYVVADGIRIVKEDNDHNSIVDEAGVEFASGNQSVTLSTATDTIMRSVTISPPANGYVVVNASGYWFASAGAGGARCSIVQSPASTIDITHLMAGNVESGRSMPFSATRVFTVTKNTSATFRLVCDAFTGVAPQARDSSLSAIFSTTRY